VPVAKRQEDMGNVGVAEEEYLIGIHHIHDDTTLQHLSQASLDSKVRRGGNPIRVGRFLCMYRHCVVDAHNLSIDKKDENLIKEDEARSMF
jgi:hypothetical protein